MEEDKNLEQNLDNSNGKLHISDVSVCYFKCDKCGHKISTMDGSGITCQQPAFYRTSGICCGSYNVPISKLEFITH